MRLKHLTIFFAILAAATLPRTAHAQDSEYDSWGLYDSGSDEISGYSRTVDYMGYGADLWADTELLSPTDEIVDSNCDEGVGEAEADLYYIPGQTGDYDILGSHYYDGDGWNWLGDSYYSVGVTSLCPTAIQVSDTTQLDLPYGDLRTGIGIVTAMLVSPEESNFNGAQLQELTDVAENDCPAAFATCNGSDTFTVGTGASTFGQDFGAQQNVFYDQHTFTDSLSVLHVTGTTSCTMTCVQAYMCNDVQIGRTFTIYRTFTRDTINGQGVTRVGVTKN